MYPYPTNSELKDLSQKTNLDSGKIKRWFEYKRLKSRKTREDDKTPKQYFTKKDKAFLENFFYSESICPGPKDLEYMSDVLNKDKAKIRAWFSYKRFISKKNL